MVILYNSVFCSSSLNPKKGEGEGGDFQALGFARVSLAFSNSTALWSSDTVHSISAPGNCPLLFPAQTLTSLPMSGLLSPCYSPSGLSPNDILMANTETLPGGPPARPLLLLSSQLLHSSSLCTHLLVSKSPPDPLH